MPPSKFAALIYYWFFQLRVLFWLAEMVYRSKVWFRFFWYRLRGREGENRQVVGRIVPPWARRILKTAGCEVELEGAEHIPREGPLLLMVNHQSMYDVPVLLGHLGRVMGFVTKKELFSIPAFSFWMR